MRSSALASVMPCEEGFKPQQLERQRCDRPVHRHQNSRRKDCDSKFLLQTDEMDGKGETGGLQRSHGAHPERTGQAQNGRVTSRLPGNGNFPR